MISDRQVLVVDGADGALSAVMDELHELGFRVIWVPMMAAALDFVRASPRLSLVLVSAAAAQLGGPEFLSGVKAIRPALRIIWGVRPDAMRIRKRRPSLDTLIPEPVGAGTLRETLSALLAECFYPSSIANAVKTAALEVLGIWDEFEIEGDSFLVPNHSALSELSAIIGFSGQATGQLLISMNSTDAKTLHGRMLPNALGVATDRLEDLVGELCNQILGRINAFFARYSFEVTQTTPLFIRSAGSSLRYAGQHPSFGIQLVSGQTCVSLEYYLADFDKAMLLVGSPDQVMNAGEVHFL